MNNSTLILIGALVLLGAKGGSIGTRKKGTITWDGWCDNSIFGECYDWDYRVVVQVDDYRVSSSQVLGYNWDAQNSNSWKMVLDKTLESADLNRPEGMPSFDQIDWDIQYTKGWEDAQKGFDFTSIKQEIVELVKGWICINYPPTCVYLEVVD